MSRVQAKPWVLKRLFVGLGGRWRFRTGGFWFGALVFAIIIMIITIVVIISVMFEGIGFADLPNALCYFTETCSWC